MPVTRSSSRGAPRSTVNSSSTNVQSPPTTTIVPLSTNGTIVSTTCTAASSASATNPCHTVQTANPQTSSSSIVSVSVDELADLIRSEVHRSMLAVNQDSVATTTPQQGLHQLSFIIVCAMFDHTCYPAYPLVVTQLVPH